MSQAVVKCKDTRSVRGCTSVCSCSSVCLCVPQCARRVGPTWVDGRAVPFKNKKNTVIALIADNFRGVSRTQCGDSGRVAKPGGFTSVS
eukprot:457084-Prymnesium_polylepis.1